ncbi:Na+ dependent nucleoside transporter domain protein [Desulfovibrio sp. X2]|uniref:NupC/NupG family nucleoside CNT transporter n=1 Tax=Desulfovibrio sp. X2 TaxID=941449 RepID=UPI000358A128|nr:nucleoside transporter C-terminal domain-containing protein [Desulfovibrio sp. X2]EPR41810.1 Na+ dependent nucleoside transporter domain protein [Desulfovibrio sp. X2]
MLHSALGLLALCLLCWLISENRRAVCLRFVAVGLVLQVAVALALTRIPVLKDVFLRLNDLVGALEKATMAGTAFVFGYLGGGALPFHEPYPGSSFILAFRALPLVLVVSALSSLLFYWRVIPVVVGFFAWALRRTLGVGGAVGVAVAANVFVGMVEGPLLIKEYLERMTRSELFTVMTAGMATIAGTVMFLYASFLKDVIPDSLGQILIASIISAPAAIVVSRIMIPETEEPTGGGLPKTQGAGGSMDAVTRGTAEGLTLLLNIAAMLIVLVALVSLANQMLGWLPSVAGAPLTMQRMLGWVMAPLVWLIGVPWSEAHAAGALMGTKIVLNEFIAYLDLAKLPPDVLSERSRIIMTYAMCGFANFGSLGIMIGGLGAMAPKRRSEIVSLGMRTIVSGTLATLMTGAVIGMLL